MRCSFCRRRSGPGQRMVGASEQQICSECLSFARQLAAQKVS
ncbi:MAG: hypothetical protein FJ145_05970 [Deltaproteobacteria bacterium]|nr:hypothetical protein [Deltaproteobacteria bacterium]